jgi:uncharacterized protein (TIGR02594 family)
MKRKLQMMRRKHAQTRECIEMDALYGIMKDGAATTLYNYFTEFGLAQISVDFVLGTAGTNVQGNPYWARNWLLFGHEVQPISSAVLVFERGSGGHVGFAIGQDDTHFYALGGNQSDAVTIARIAKSRLLGARWPETYRPRRQRLPTMKLGEFIASTDEI